MSRCRHDVAAERALVARLSVGLVDDLRDLPLRVAGGLRGRDAL